MREAHEERTRLQFTWLTREHSFNKTTKFDPDEWTLHSGPHPTRRSHYRLTTTTAEYLYASTQPFLDIQHPLSFSQHASTQPFLDIQHPLPFSQHDIRTWIAHEMIEEGKLLKMIYSILHDSLLATETGNSATRPGNSTTIGRTATKTIGPSAKTTGDRKQPKRPSESQLQGDLNRQRDSETPHLPRDHIPDRSRPQATKVTRHRNNSATTGWTHPPHTNGTECDKQRTTAYPPTACDTREEPQKSKGI
jgi:hypothetical protein